MRKRPKSKTLSWYCRNLVNEYMLDEIDDEDFKEKLQFMLDKFTWQGGLLQNTAASLCSWLIERRYTEGYKSKVRKICDLTSEVNPQLGEMLRRCDFYSRL